LFPEFGIEKMSEVADTIPELTTILPLNFIGDEFLGKTVYLGEFSSLSTIIYADMNCTLDYEFSGDGFNFDYVDSAPVIATITLRKSLVIVAKYIRIRITDTGGPMTELRCFTYGSVDNTALDAIVGGVLNVNLVGPLPVPVDIVSPIPLQVDIVNPLPLPVDIINPNPISVVIEPGAPGFNAVSITDPVTLYTDLKVSELRADIQYMFTKGVLGTILPKTWEYPYSDLKCIGTSNTGTSLLVPNSGFVDMQIVHALVPLDPGCEIVFAGRSMSFRAGQQVCSRFQSWFQQGIRGALDSSTGMGVGMGFLKPGGSVENFAGFGYPEGSTLAALEFGIILIRAGTRFFFPQTIWNIDVCDGSGQMPLMNSWKFKNSFEVCATDAIIRFKVLNPNTGQYNPVHQHDSTNDNITALLQDFNLGFLAFQTRLPGVNTANPNTDHTAISNWMMGVQGNMSSTYERFAVGTPTFQALSAGNEVAFMMIKQAAELKPLGELCYTCVNFDWFNFASNVTCLWKLYRNRVLTAPVLVHVPDQLTLCPVTVGIPGFGGSTPGVLPAVSNGILMFAWHSVGTETFEVNMTQYNIWLDQDDTLLLTCTGLGAVSPNYSASFACGYSNEITRQ
jgi:hypothetical protein